MDTEVMVTSIVVTEVMVTSIIVTEAMVTSIIVTLKGYPNSMPVTSSNVIFTVGDN